MTPMALKLLPFQRITTQKSCVVIRRMLGVSAQSALPKTSIYARRSESPNLGGTLEHQIDLSLQRPDFLRRRGDVGQSAILAR